MNTLDIIALIAEPDAEVRMTSIKRLALLETQPKLNMVRVEIKEFKLSPFPNVVASVILSTGGQVDVTYDNFEQLNKYVPKAAPVAPPYVNGAGKAPNNVDFKLSLNNGSSCLIDAAMANKLYNLVPKPPIAEYIVTNWIKVKGRPTELELQTTDVVVLPDATVTAIYEKMKRVEGKSDKLIEILDKLSNAIETNDDLTFNDVKEEYKQWRKENM